jgi:hypothetical protein
VDLNLIMTVRTNNRFSHVILDSWLLVTFGTRATHSFADFSAAAGKVRHNFRKDLLVGAPAATKFRI